VGLQEAAPADEDADTARSANADAITGLGIMYFANPACAADNSVWVLPTASFDLEHAASSGCKSALGVAARRGVWGLKITVLPATRDSP
jgi:hypothetical protein